MIGVVLATLSLFIGLSGGQKSLLSMSFIFALAGHKASPVYLLDEIDAALDERYQVKSYHCASPQTSGCR
jgi:structural maintenance of chromosome 4